MALHIVILAAGLGKRMHSSKPKVLHTIAGKPMLTWVVDTALQLQPEAIHIVVGKNSEEIKKYLPSLPVNWVVQEQQLGTGHAVKQALPHIPKDAQVLILYADIPLIQKKSLLGLINHGKGQNTSLTLLVAILSNPHGLGRIQRDTNEKVVAIIEEKDANEQQQKIKEIYSGICYIEAHLLHKWLPNITCKNAQKDFFWISGISA